MGLDPDLDLDLDLDFEGVESKYLAVTGLDPDPDLDPDFDLDFDAEYFPHTGSVSQPFSSPCSSLLSLIASSSSIPMPKLSVPQIRVRFSTTGSRLGLGLGLGLLFRLER